MYKVALTKATAMTSAAASAAPDHTHVATTSSETSSCFSFPGTDSIKQHPEAASAATVEMLMSRVSPVQVRPLLMAVFHDPGGIAPPITALPGRLPHRSVPIDTAVGCDSDRLKIGERKRHDDHVAAYKFRHASSSSGVSQSAAQADSASGSGANALRQSRSEVERRGGT